MKVFLAGATGVIGKPLVSALVEAGHYVIGMTRSEQKREELKQAGADPVICDALNQQSLIRLVCDTKPNAIIHQLTQIPQHIDPRKLRTQFSMTNRLRRVGTRNLVTAAIEAGVETFVAQSVAFAYRPGPPSLRCEPDPLYLDAPGGAGEIFRAVDELEKQILTESRLQGTILRYGYLYGPGTAYDCSGAFVSGVKANAIPIIGKGGGVFSFVHVRDAVSATMCALACPSGTYNVVDDDPAPAREWMPTLADLVGAKRPATVPSLIGRIGAGWYATYMMTRMPGASNQKARTELGWDPEYKSWRVGFSHELTPHLSYHC